MAILLGVYSKVHDPTGEQPYSLFFTGTINLKVWFATAAVALVLFQGVSALRLFGRFPGTIYHEKTDLTSGRLAFGSDRIRRRLLFIVPFVLG